MGRLSWFRRKRFRSRVRSRIGQLTGVGASTTAVQLPSAGKPVERVGMGSPALDEMLGGGLPRGYSLLVAGPAGHLGVIDTRSLDLDIDVTMHELLEMIERMQAKRVVIDSLSGFELALAPTYSENFRDSLYRMVAVLTGKGVTVLMTSELEDRYTDLRFSPYGAAFLTDAIIVQRYIELKSEFPPRDRGRQGARQRAQQPDSPIRNQRQRPGHWRTAPRIPGVAGRAA